MGATQRRDPQTSEAIAALRSERDTAKSEVNRRIKLEHALAEVSRQFTGSDESGYQRALAILGDAVGVDRVRVFRFRDGLARVDNILEWCAEGVESQQSTMQDLESSLFGWWLEKIRRGEDIVIEDVGAMPPEAATERQLLEAQGARSVLAVPLTDRSGQLSGFMGFVDESKVRRWSPEDVRLLHLAGEMLSITFARERAERELARKNEALVAALEAKTDFLSMVSHELRAPLTVILGHAEVLLEQGDFTGRASEWSSVRSILRNSLRLRKQINDLLTLVAGDDGRIELESRAVPVRGLLEELVAETAQIDFGKPVDIALCGDDIEVQADAERLRQVLDNLVENAVKFSPERAEIVIESRRSGSHGALAVADLGPGMPTDYLPRAFDRFSQQGAAADRAHAGSGLGLAIVKQLTELMGGHVALASREGHGTCVTVSLPLAAQGESAPEAPGDEPAGAAEDLETPPHLVVIDDDRDALELIEIILAQDCEVAAFASPVEGLRHLEQHGADLVLLDWMMPGLDGLAVIERLRSSPSTREIPVVLISGKADRASILRASECGAKAHLPKPFGQAELRRTVARWARPRAASRSRDR